MAQSENLASIDPWTFRPTITDSWFAEAIARDAETLTKALQKSLSGAAAATTAETLVPDTISPFLNLVKPDNASTTTATPTASGLSGSDQESAPKRQRTAVPTAAGATGKVSKRKSRASKRSQTTFITADPANFRQMVQQVTGVRFGNSSQVSMAPILKPEPQRLGTGRLPAAGGCLPTLDTSAFLLDHHQQQVVGHNYSSSAAAAVVAGTGVSGAGPLPFVPPVGVVDSALPSASLDFDTFSSFPTLESWKVM